MKFYTLKDLKATGLPMYSGTVLPDVKIGQIYLQDRVINSWDFSDYSKFYTYFHKVDNLLIHSVVYICKKIDENRTEFRPLHKDLNNLNAFEEKK